MLFRNKYLGALILSLVVAFSATRPSYADQSSHFVTGFKPDPNIIVNGNDPQIGYVPVGSSYTFYYYMYVEGLQANGQPYNVTISPYKWSGSSMWSVQNDSCFGQTIYAGAQGQPGYCYFDIVFTPTAIGVQQAIFTYGTDFDGGPVSTASTLFVGGVGAPDITDPPFAILSAANANCALANQDYPQNQYLTGVQFDCSSPAIYFENCISSEPGYVSLTAPCRVLIVYPYAGSNPGYIGSDFSYTCDISDTGIYPNGLIQYNSLGCSGSFLSYVKTPSFTSAPPTWFPTQASPTLTIDPASVVITQAVDNFILPGQSAITLVQGKSTAIQAQVLALNIKPTDISSITVTATLDDGTTVSQTVSAQTASASGGTLVTLPPLIPSSTGMSHVTVTATDSTDGAPSSAPVVTAVSVLKTNPLGIVYVPVTGYFGNLSNDPGGTVQEHQAMSDEFMQGIFPVAENGINSQIAQTASGSSGTTQQGNTPIVVTEVIDDMLQTLEIGTKTNPFARNSVGIVPQGYFPNHIAAQFGLDSGTRGVTFTNQTSGLPAPVSLVTNGYWGATAHEIGHTFALPHVANSSSVNGFWVDENLRLTNLSDFMIESGALFQNKGTPLSVNPSDWISESEFSTILNLLENNPSDPQVIVVAGTLSSSGTITLQPTFFIPNGVATSFNATAAANVQAVASDGSLIAQASFNPSFNLTTDLGAEIQTNTSIFLVQLPYSQSTETVQIVQSGKMLSSFNPSSQLLVDAIQEIPDTSFIKDADREERSLLNQAKRIESRLDFCQKWQSDRNHDNWFRVMCMDEVEEFVLRLRSEISRKLNDSTATTNPLQLKKNEVLSTVDFIALQLLGSPTIQAAGRTLVLGVLPPDSREVLSISAVTQGTNGSVSMNNDGTVIYKPLPGKPETDSFTITIQDVDGAAVTKTVSIILPCLDVSSTKRWATRFSSISWGGGI